MIYLAFYSCNGGEDLLKRFTDRFIKIFTRGDFSHVEIAIKDGESFHCYSSSGRDKGVRKKIIELGDKWTLIDISSLVTVEQVSSYYSRTSGKKYDYIGCVGTALNFLRSPEKYFCSEWCYNAITRTENGGRYSPQDLYHFFNDLVKK